MNQTAPRNPAQEKVEVSYVEALIAQATAADPRITSYEVTDVLDDGNGTTIIGMLVNGVPISMSINVTP